MHSNVTSLYSDFLRLLGSWSKKAEMGEPFHEISLMDVEKTKYQSWLNFGLRGHVYEPYLKGLRLNRPKTRHRYTGLFHVPGFRSG